jgi:hypothetical protein
MRLHFESGEQRTDTHDRIIAAADPITEQTPLLESLFALNKAGFGYKRLNAPDDEHDVPLDMRPEELDEHLDVLERDGDESVQVVVDRINRAR